MTLKMVTMATSVLSCRSCPHCWNWCCHLSYRFLHSRMIHVDLYHNSIKDEIEYEKFDNIININQTRSQEVQKWRLLAVNLDWRDRLFLYLFLVINWRWKVKFIFLIEKFNSFFSLLTCDFNNRSTLRRVRSPHHSQPTTTQNSIKICCSILSGFVMFCGFFQVE